MKKFGLYTVDKSKKLGLEGYNQTDLSWRRTGLFFNGSMIDTTCTETNKFGLYVADSILKLNGNNVATSADTICNPVDSNSKLVSGKGLTISEDGIRLNEVVLKSTKCINITLSDYIALRNGEDVEGYSRYNDKTPYRIVDDVAQAEEVDYVIPDDIQPVDDIIFNSLTEELAYDSQTEEYHDNELNDNTFLDVNAPEVIIRGFDAKIKEGESLELQYFVDTRHCDSINKGIIGDTFTTIVEDAAGNVLYHKTTYAGEFRCKIAPFKTQNDENFVGATWFSIRCVDNNGRGSVEYFFDVLIEENREKVLYEVTLDDYVNSYDDIVLATESSMGKYNIRVDLTQYDFVAGYRNLREFDRLFHDAKALGYDGVKLYNAKGGTTYYIDRHYNLATYPEIRLDHITDYYLVKYENGTIKGLEDVPFNQWDINTFERFKLQANNQMPIDVDGNVYTVGDDVFDWIRWDGAHIYRDENDKIVVAWKYALDPREIAATTVANNTRVLRMKSLNALIYNANHITGGKTYFDYIFKEGEGYYYLNYSEGGKRTVDSTSKIHSWSHIGAGDVEMVKYNHTQETGLDGVTPEHISDLNLQTPSEYLLDIPDNFVIDFNDSTWACTDCTDIGSDILLFYGRHWFNVTLCNGHIKGSLEDEDLKPAYLKTLKYTPKYTWEGLHLVNSGNAKFLTYDNMEFYNVAGYQFGFNAYTDFGIFDKNHVKHSDVAVVSNGTANESSDTNYWANYDPNNPSTYPKLCLNSLGYIDANGEQISQNIVLKDNSNQSILASTSYYRDYGATDVCLASTPSYLDIDKWHYYYVRNNKDIHITSLKSFYVDSDSKYHDRHGGPYNEVFVHFYDEQNNLLKTIKTHHFLTIKIPNGAVKFKLTGYSVCSIVDNTPVLTLKGTGLAAYDSFRCNDADYARNVVMSNCYVHHTKSCAAQGGGQNVLFKNCVFEQIAAVYKDFVVTPCLIDIEEQAGRTFLYSFINCIAKADQKPTDSIYGNSQTKVKSGLYLRGFYFNNCVGFGFKGVGVELCRLSDSEFSYLGIGLYANTEKGDTNIIKRINAHQEGDFLWSETIHREKNSFIINTNYDPIVNIATISEVFFNSLSYVHTSGEGYPAGLKCRKVKLWNTKHAGTYYYYPRIESQAGEYDKDTIQALIYSPNLIVE